MIKVNLLKPEKKDVGGMPDIGAYGEETKESKINVPVIILSAAITIGLIGYFYFTQSSEINSKQKEVEEKKIEKKRLDAVLNELRDLEKTKAELERKINIIKELKSKQKHTVIVMDLISKSLPDWVWLTKMSFSGGKINLTGKALSNNLISDFINNLNGTNKITNVDLKSSVKKRVGGEEIYHFTITGYYIGYRVNKNKKRR